MVTFNKINTDSLLIFNIIYDCAGSLLLLASFSLVSRCRLLIAVVSFAVEQVLGPVGLVAQQHMESSRPGIKPLSSALAGIFLTSGPSGKFSSDSFNMTSYLVHIPNFSFNPRMSWRTAGFPPPQTGAFQIKYCNFYSFFLISFSVSFNLWPLLPTPPTHTHRHPHFSTTALIFPVVSHGVI